MPSPYLIIFCLRMFSSFITYELSSIQGKPSLTATTRMIPSVAILEYHLHSTLQSNFTDLTSYYNLLLTTTQRSNSIFSFYQEYSRQREWDQAGVPQHHTPCAGVRTEFWLTGPRWLHPRSALELTSPRKSTAVTDDHFSLHYKYFPCNLSP